MIIKSFLNKNFYMVGLKIKFLNNISEVSDYKIKSSDLVSSHTTYNKNINLKLNHSKVIPFEKIFKGNESNALWIYSHTLNENSTKAEGLRLVDILPINILPKKTQSLNLEPLESLKPICFLEKNIEEEKKIAFRKMLEIRKIRKLVKEYHAKKAREDLASVELLKKMTRKERLAYLRDNLHLIFIAFLLGLITINSLIKLIKLKRDRIKKFVYKLRRFSENTAYQIFLTAFFVFFGASFILLPGILVGISSFLIMRNAKVLVKSILSKIGIVY